MKYKLSSKQKIKLLKKENVVGVGYGKKIVKGKQTNKDCIAFLVSKKIPLTKLYTQDVIQKEIEGVVTDVIETGIIKALPVSKGKIRKRTTLPTEKHRPAIGGVSIGHEDITAGTLGCIVYKNKLKYILSNNHVIANSNNAQIGDSILQPGPHDGGTIEEKIATLESFVEIKLTQIVPTCSIANAAQAILNFFTRLFAYKYRWKLSKISSEVNQVDAAIAKPLNQDLVKDEILEIGKIKGIADAEIGMKVQKSGRTTGYTTGEVLVLDATVNVQYGLGKFAVFENQIIAGPMSQGGDSGSVVLDMKNNLIGLLFAGSKEVTIMNPIKKVFELLKVTR